MDGTVSQRFIYKNSRLKLEYAYLLFNKFKMSRINSEMMGVLTVRHRDIRTY